MSLQVFAFSAHRQLRIRIATLLETTCQRRPRQDPVSDGFYRREQQWVERDRDQCARQDETHAFHWQQIERHPKSGQDERELTDLRKAGRDSQGRVERIAERQHQREGSGRLAQNDHGNHRQHMQRLFQQYLGLEQHAHRYEKQDRKRIAQRQRLLRRAMTELGFAHDHACEEGT
ncbi:hypothetical protein D9M70_383820 [compost metagenome]